MDKVLFMLFISLINIAEPQQCATSYKKPDDLKFAEEHCWYTEMEISEQIAKMPKNLLNIVRQRLGLLALQNNNNEPIKCEYYKCIFQQLRMINNNGYPVYNDIINWIENNVIYIQAGLLIQQLNRCNEALRNCTVLEQNFYSDRILKQIEEWQFSENEGKRQNPCEIAKEFFKCLSINQQCPVFEFLQ